MAKATGYIHVNLSSWMSAEEDKPTRVDDQFDSDRAPDLIENVLAWRGWDVIPTGHLTASAVQGVWDPGANKAVCRHAGHTEDVPAVGCGCGFYGWHEPSDVSHGQIRGAIKCWGEIIVHDVGVRAEWAEILCLFQSTTHEPWLRRAAERYEVPLVETQEEAEALVADQGIRVPESMRPERKPDELEYRPLWQLASSREEAEEFGRYLHYYTWGAGHGGGAVYSGSTAETAKPKSKNKAEELIQRKQEAGQQRAGLHGWDHKAA